MKTQRRKQWLSIKRGQRGKCARRWCERTTQNPIPTGYWSKEILSLTLVGITLWKDFWSSGHRAVLWECVTGKISWCVINYRLTYSASELSGFTCTSSLTMNEKFQYRTRPSSALLKNFEFIVSERVQVNPDNSRAMSALTFLWFKLNTLQAKIVKFWVSKSHGVMTVVYRIYTMAITPR